MSAGSFERPGLRVVWGPLTERADADRALAELVAAHLGRAVAIGRHCQRCGSVSHGRPVVDDPSLSLSLSRATGLAVVAISWTGEVGVDVEPAGRASFAGFDGVAVHPDEAPADPTLTWVRKEALLKASGHGLALDPRRVRLDPDGQLREWDNDLPDPARCRLTTLPLPEGYVGAVAVIGSAGSPAASSSR